MLVGARDFIVFKTIQTTQPSIQWALEVFLHVKWLRRGVDHSSPSSAEVRDEWRYTSVSLMCLHGVERDKFTLTCICIMSTCYIYGCTAGSGE